MKVILEKNVFLKVLNFSDSISISVSENGVVVVGEASNGRAFLQYKKGQLVDFLSDEEIIIDKEEIQNLSAFIKGVGAKAEKVEFTRESGMPEVSVNLLATDPMNGLKSIGRIFINLKLDDDLFSQVNLNPDLLQDKSANMTRDILEMINRSNKFVIHNSEVEQAQYVAIEVKGHDNLLVSGFSGQSGYEESMPIINKPKTNPNNSFSIHIHSTTAKILTKASNKSILNTSDVYVGISESNDMYVFKDEDFSIFLPIDVLDPIDFKRLFQRSFNKSLANIDLSSLQLALKSIPNVNNRAGVLKLSKEGLSVLIGTDRMAIPITEDGGDDFLNMYFTSREINAYLTNSKQIKLNSIVMDLDCDNKILKMSSQNELVSNRFIIVGSRLTTDEEVFA